MEDILDEFAYEALQRELTAKEADHQARPSKVRKLISTCLGIFNPNVNMRSKVLEITRRLRDISAQNLSFSMNLRSMAGDRKEIIIGMLLRNEPTKTNFSVVSIVAMGGMGKTTLARLVYDDDETITKHFDKKPGFVSQISSMQKKFLIVLDDLWNDDYFDTGSKILVTTRNNNVANKMRGHKILHELKQLPYDDCLKIFQTHAFEHMNIDEHPNLESIGRRIVEKCGGSPLAARALGGLLRSELRECEWERVLYSKVWDFTDKECDIIPALRLSYYHLSSHLKRFYKARVNPPVDGGGLIQQSKDNRKMEDLGDKYFDELLSRSFLNPKSIAGDTCLHLDDALRNDLQCFNSENTRHSSFIRHFVLEELIPRLGHLRVLSLAHYMIREIPDSFGDIKWLPDSIGNLFYLQTLKLSCCEKLIKLPISIGNLINLRHLDVAGAIQLQEMPVQIGKLKDLRILSNFIVDKSNGLTIKGLKDMSHLRELCISKLENVVNIQDARDADLKLKRNLESLIMQWSSELDGSGNERNQMDVLDSLQPCLNLNKLCIEWYGGPEFPRWIGDALFSKMVDLSLIDCRKCTSLPCLGQLPSLKQLRIQGMVGHWEDWSSSTESLFPCLHELTIDDCPKLIMKLPTDLPSLTKLSVHFCPKLIRECNEAVLSSGNDLTSLTKLTISGILGLIKLHEGFYRNVKNSYICGRMVLDRKTLILLRLEIVTNLDCPKLASFPDVGFPPMLRNLILDNCEGLKCLPNGMMLKMRNDSTNSNNLCLLECLSIWDCPSLICFPKGQLPTTLKSLSIICCENLKSLPEGMMGMCALEGLSIVELESLPEGIMRQHSTNAAALQGLEIRICPSLTSFPIGKYPNLKTLPDCLNTLTDLSIEDFENLELLLPQIKTSLVLHRFSFKIARISRPPIPMGLFQTHLS
ncbi:hypothetical protein AAG906_024692 [Vitis piasezkii]